MDTSKKYIEMCSKATEIQGLIRNRLIVSETYRPNTSFQDTLYDFLGFYFFRKDIAKFFICTETDTTKSLNIKGFNNYVRGDIWLPRQDQLQEMIIQFKNNFGFEGVNSGIFINNIHIFQKLMYNEYKIIFNSLEECYLSFLMKEKFNKTWNKNKKEWDLI